MLKNNYAFIIPAGGLGSRLYPLTKEYPKPYLPIYFDEKNNIIRMIDLPIAFCKKYNIPIYIAIDYKKEKLEYLKQYNNIKIINTNYVNVANAILDCLDLAKKDNIKYYSVFAPDFLIPEKILIDMMKIINDDIETVALCSDTQNYTKINLKCNNGYLNYNTGITVSDLTFHIEKLDRGIDSIKKLLKNNTNDLWECKYSKNNQEEWLKARILITDVKHIDMGTPNTYYEVLYKLNKSKVDKNGNIVFPNAKINPNSKNIIALPNSNSKNYILSNCIIPENKEIENINDVLYINEIRNNKFNKILIKDFI